MKDWGRLVHRTVITECRKIGIASAKGREYEQNLGGREFGV